MNWPMTRVKTVVYHINTNINTLSDMINDIEFTKDEKEEIELYIKLTRDKLNLLDKFMKRINPPTQIIIPKKDKCPVCGKEVILTDDEMECLATTEMCCQCFQERLKRKTNENKNI